MDNQEKPSSSLAQSVLPWAVGGGALLLFLATVSHWVTLGSLPTAARVTGWDWSPPLTAPLHYLLTLPLRQLSPAVQPLALNCLAALFAACTLMLLARSVALLPHDRTREQRQRERSDYSLLSLPTAWLPPLFAVLVCGLQLTFWEHATAATGEMLNLLLFAYIIRCLLEYRIDLRDGWLDRIAIVYGLAVANNWAMIGFFPFFLAALIWIRGLTFFQGNFMLRALGLGLVGLTLYLVLPAVAVAADPTGPTSYGDYLRVELAAQKNFLLGYPKGRVLLLSLTSLLPLLVMGIRWPSSLGDTSVAGAMLSSLMFRVVHGLFLVACLWVSFDPKFSPRALGYGLPFLTFYYLGALSIGYFSGYFLLVFGADPASGRSWHRAKGFQRLWQRALAGAVGIAVFAVPAGLAWKNWPSLRATHLPLLRTFADQLRNSLPAAKSAVVLSEDNAMLLLLKAALSTDDTRLQLIPVDVKTLAYRSYHRHLQRTYPGRWPDLVTKEDAGEGVDADGLGILFNSLAVTNEIYYLHPCFGYLFEGFYPLPHGLVQQLRPYGTNLVAAPPVPEQVLAEGLAFWQSAAGAVAAVAPLSQARLGDARTIGAWYARLLNQWGVDLQRVNRIEDAGRAFALARQANPDNLTAGINADYNLGLRQGKRQSIVLGKSREDLLRQYRTWNELLFLQGPIDEPGLCFQIGQHFAQLTHYRQAALQFLRVATLDPDRLDARFWLANMYLMGQLPDEVLSLTREIRARHGAQIQEPANQIELVRLEALARFGKGEVAEAEKALVELQARFPKEDAILDSLFYLYFGTKRFADVIRTLDKQLELNPKNPSALLNKGATLIELKDYQGAIPLLDQALQIRPEDRGALRNRAIAHLQSGHLDAAQADYEALRKIMPSSHVVHYGLGELAYLRKEISKAIGYYETFLRLAPKGTAEIDDVKRRLEQLKSGRAAP